MTAFDWGSLSVENQPPPMPKQYGHRGIPSAQCPGCGRFARYVGGHHYYNGHYDCFSFDTDCKRCGIQTTECV